MILRKGVVIRTIHNMYVYIYINVVLIYVTEHRKRDHFGQKFKTELLVPPYSSYLGLCNDTFWEATSATTMKIQDAKVAPHGKLHVH